MSKLNAFPTIIMIKCFLYHLFIPTYSFNLYLKIILNYLLFSYIIVQCLLLRLPATESLKAYFKFLLEIF